MKQVCVHAQVDNEFEKGCCFDCPFAYFDLDCNEFRCPFNWMYDECKLEIEDV